jgi:acyl carrier protein
VDNVLSHLQPIFRDVFDDPSLTVTAESSASTVEGWDSLAQINLVSAIEQEFKIRFRFGELEKLKNVAEMVELIKTKLKP